MTGRRGSDRRARGRSGADAVSLDPGERCLLCGRQLSEVPPPLFLTSPMGYTCGEKCHREHERRRDYFIRVVMGDPVLTSRWLRGEDFPERTAEGPAAGANRKRKRKKRRRCREGKG